MQYTKAQWKKYWQHKKVSVLGMGISNRPLIPMLVEAGAVVKIYDQHPVEELGEVAMRLAAMGVQFGIWDPDSKEILLDDIIFRSPGIRPDCRPIKDALARGAKLTSEMELFLELTPATVIGVTGSDGKTTTTTLTHLMLSKHCDRVGKGHVYVGGNIGTPLLSRVFDMTEEDFAVVELSSFQLSTMRRSPTRAAITNVTPNHLNWHVDMDEYIMAKSQICRHKPIKRMVVNADNAVTFTLGRNSDLFVSYFSSRRHNWMTIIPEWQEKAKAFYVKDGWICSSGPRLPEEKWLDTSTIVIPGKHNIENFMCAIALLDGLIDAMDAQEIASSFGGVEHRLEFVRMLNGVKYYNSSIDSSPSRSLVTLTALGGSPIAILCGRDKHLSYDELAPYMHEHCKAIVLTGEALPIVKKALEPINQDGKLSIYEEETFEEAVNRARSIATDGDTVVLSPSCTSFDHFKNFEERGNIFKHIVQSFEG